MGVSLGRTTRALALSCHPGPVVMVTSFAVVLAVALGFDPGRVLVIALATLLGQLSIGFSNDWIDAGRDTEVRRTDKPIAAGRIRVSTVRAAAVLTAALGVVAGFTLGPAAGIAHTIAVAGGWSYNAWLKNTVFSVLPFLVSFGVYPLFVTLSAAEPAWSAPWVIAVGALLGVAIHFTNVLPDLDEDARTGIRGTPHRLGLIPSGLVAFGTLLVASALVAFAPIVADPQRAPTVASVVGLAVNAAIAGAGVFLVLTRPPQRLLFQFIAGSGLLTVVLLALSGTRLVA